MGYGQTSLSVRRETAERLEKLRLRKYPKAVTANELIGTMIDELSKDLEPEREIIKRLR